MKSLLSAPLLGLLLSLNLPAADIAALVIGNNEYPVESRLDTPVNDAVLMAKTLGTVAGVDTADLTFSINEPSAEYAKKLQVLIQRLAPSGILLVTDATRDDFYKGLARFKSVSKGSRLAFVAYSGHGLDNPTDDGSQPETYLVPVDAKIQDPDQLESQAVPLSDLTKVLSSSGAIAKVAVLDCCRDNLTRRTPAFASSTKSLRSLDDSVRTSLGAASLPDATLLAFATSPGRKAAAFIAQDDENSPFTKFLALHLLQPGLSLRDAFDRAADATEDATEKRQSPYVRYDGASRILREIVLLPASLSHREPESVAGVWSEAEKVKKLAPPEWPSAEAHVFAEPLSKRLRAKFDPSKLPKEYGISGQDTFVGVRVAIPGSSVWGVVARSGTSWDEGRWVILGERDLKAPDRFPENGSRDKKRGFDNEVVYKITGFFSGRTVYDVCSDREFPEFVPKEFSQFEP